MRAKYATTACGAVTLRFDTVSSQYKINLWYRREGTMRVLICGSRGASLNGKEVCDLEGGCGRHNKYKENAFCFGKSKQGVTFLVVY